MQRGKPLVRNSGITNEIFFLPLNSHENNPPVSLQDLFPLKRTKIKDMHPEQQLLGNMLLMASMGA